MYYKLKTNITDTDTTNILLSKKKVDSSWTNVENLETKENGSYYTYYNEDGTPNLTEEQKVEDEVFNGEVYKQIELLESSLTRPMRELLSTSTSEEDKIFAQSKVDSIEAEIKALRATLK